MDRKIEQALIWRMIEHPEEIQDVSEILSPDDFFDALYKNSFRTMLRMKKENKIVDLPAVYTEMGRPSNISSIIDQVEECLFPASHYAMLIKQRNIENEIQVAAKGREYDEVQRRIEQLRQLGQPTDLQTITDLVAKGEERHEILKTGYKDLDFVVKLETTDLFILAGRPSVGKSIFGTVVLANMAQEFPVGLISFEMTGEKIVKRLFKNYGIDYLNSINLNFNVACPTAFNLMEIRRALREMKLKKGIRAVMIDYLQLMSEPKRYQSRHLEVSDVIRQLKQMAKEFDVAMIVVSSLSRETDHRGEKSRPALGDLKESGDIEYAADIVGFLYREPKQLNAELIIAKNRNGEQAIIELVWLNNRLMYGTKAWQEERERYA
jgi:replicative DNA helicase